MVISDGAFPHPDRERRSWGEPVRGCVAVFASMPLSWWICRPRRSALAAGMAGGAVSRSWRSGWVARGVRYELSSCTWTSLLSIIRTLKTYVGVVFPGDSITAMVGEFRSAGRPWLLCGGCFWLAQNLRFKVCLLRVFFRSGLTSGWFPWIQDVKLGEPLEVLGVTSHHHPVVGYGGGGDEGIGGGAGSGMCKAVAMRATRASTERVLWAKMSHTSLSSQLRRVAPATGSRRSASSTPISSSWRVITEI